MKERNNSGQALLIILLIMAVALTIGLSVVSRSVTDIRISQEQEESARVFSAAEAGLESLLATGEAPGSVGDFKIDTGTKPIGDSETFVFPKEITCKYDSKDKKCTLEFSLPKGSYATVLIENIANRNLN